MQLYRSRFLHTSIRWKALAEIYKIHAVPQLSNLKFLSNSCRMFPNFYQNLLFSEISLTFAGIMLWQSGKTDDKNGERRRKCSKYRTPIFFRSQKFCSEVRLAEFCRIRRICQYALCVYRNTGNTVF